jgi:superkiller protein 3
VPEYHTNLGVRYWELKQPDKAEAAHREALRLRPEYGVARQNLAVALVEQGKLDEAVAEYCEARRLLPNNHIVRMNLGASLVRQGKVDEGVVELWAALTIRPNDPVIRSNLGAALSRQGKPKEALAEYQEALRTQPNHPGATNNLASLLANCPDERLRDPTEAVKLATRATEFTPTKSSYWTTLGTARYRAGDWAGALKSFIRSEELSQSPDATNAFFGAMAHWRTGDKETARRWYDRGGIPHG